MDYDPHMNIAPEGTAYCYVVRPDEPKSMPPQHSKCVFPELYDASDANGKWNVILGMEGQTDEKDIEIDVAAVQTFGKFDAEKSTKSLFDLLKNGCVKGVRFFL